MTSLPSPLAYADSKKLYTILEDLAGDICSVQPENVFAFIEMWAKMKKVTAMESVIVQVPNVKLRVPDSKDRAVSLVSFADSNMGSDVNFQDDDAVVTPRSSDLAVSDV